jgi:hypothetical protein
MPSLDLRFAETKSLTDWISGQDLMTVSRASSGTFTDSAGILQTAAVNSRRIDHNPLTGECLGLLVEEQRTNLVTSSATFQPSSAGNPASYTVDQVAPDGTTTASRQTAANPRTFIDYQGIANAQYTFSVYAKAASGTATIALQLKNAASDTVIATESYVTLTAAWRRLTVTGTTNGATAGARIEVIGPVVGAPSGTVFWGAQLEAGAFPTSYIPTTTATATRSADLASITGTNFSSWVSASTHTLFAEIQRSSAVNVNTLVAALSDGTTNNRISLRLDANGTTSTFVGVNSGTLDGVVQVTTGVAGSVIRQAGAAEVNNYQLAANGMLGTADTTALIPTVDQLEIGQVAATAQFNGTIRRLTYWPQRLPNNSLVAITR